MTDPDLTKRERDTALKRVADLERALEEYGSHTEACMARSLNEPCFCGWNRRRAALAGKEQDDAE